MRRRAPHRAPTVTWRGLHPLALQVSTGRWTPAGGSRDVRPGSRPAWRVQVSCGPRPRFFPSSCRTGRGLGRWLCSTRAGHSLWGLRDAGRAAHRHCYRHPEPRGGQRLGLAKRCNQLRVSINERVWRASSGFHRPFGKLSSVTDFRYF